MMLEATSIVWGMSGAEAYLGGALEMLDTISVDIVVRSNRLAQFVAYDHSWTLGGWPAGEYHDAAAGIRERGLNSP